jgi:hypothetical protein
MSGHKYHKYGERARDRNSRRLSQENMREIRHCIDIENSRARREGKKPQGSKIIMFSCRCNCFHIDV